MNLVLIQHYKKEIFIEDVSEFIVFTLDMIAFVKQKNSTHKIKYENITGVRTELPKDKSAQRSVL